MSNALTLEVEEADIHFPHILAWNGAQKSPTCLDAPATITAKKYGFEYSLLVQDFPHLVGDAHEV